MLETSYTVDFWLSETRDKKSAKKFFRKPLKQPHNQMPRVITTDNYTATELAILEEQYYGEIHHSVKHRMIKYLNNIVEQDHRHNKRITNNMLGFKSFKSACATIAGIEIMHMISKGQVSKIKNTVDEINFFNRLFCVD